MSETYTFGKHEEALLKHYKDLAKQENRELTFEELARILESMRLPEKEKPEP